MGEIESRGIPRSKKSENVGQDGAILTGRLDGNYQDQEEKKTHESENRKHTFRLSGIFHFSFNLSSRSGPIVAVLYYILEDLSNELYHYPESGLPFSKSRHNQVLNNNIISVKYR